MAPVDELIESLKVIEATALANEIQRPRIKDALFQTLRAVQSPWDIVWEHNWVQGITHACVKTFIDLNLFKTWAECGNNAMTCARLASLTGAEEHLIRRMMRHVAAQHLLVETAQDTFAPTPWSKTLGMDPQLASIYGPFYSQDHNPMYLNLPNFLKERGYQNPTDPNDGNWQHWKGATNDFFKDLSINHELARGFHDTMECLSRYGALPWPDIYPTETIIAAAKPGRVLIVDIGGSKGHDLEKFRMRHPDTPTGSLVLQDLPDVVQAAKVDKAIVVQAHDFFMPEPVKGARAYFLHHILHDWPDAIATGILQNVAGAMESGYSRLLLYENIITNVKAASRVTTLDLTMMACHSSKERSHDEWRELIESAGLRIMKVWRSPLSDKGIIEVELA
ncbi:hypothetical protein JDV02_005205 [Purpureocillium takamizusanense]|uniref:O-methyltransferase domain-containing protein n=1 Tax=Purpureocillium takamizusanense TaxID=2060973 RepID=A0A9Q8VBK2_9HYPO|nr:uncharacterized protein JDV02_005205 [Purpureocillium takamizusanense]UNI18979.1 hypothetical protein JDV02_005205 [Purpureocillium takamizusanense]